MTTIFNNRLIKAEFPNELKLADVTPILKKKILAGLRTTCLLVFFLVPKKYLKESYTGRLSTFMCGCRKGFSAQQALLSLIERWKNTLDQNGYGGAIVMDLSKAFDTINHDPLIAKLSAYGFETASMKLIRSYLTNHFQRPKVNTSFSSRSKLFFGVPQGSVLERLLFNIYINDLFYLTEMTDVCNYADDTTFHACDFDLKSLITRLEHDGALDIKWFESNYMLSNQDKYRFLFSGHKYEALFVNVGETKIWENKQQNILGILLDRDLKFDEYVLS